MQVRDRKCSSYSETGGGASYWTLSDVPRAPVLPQPIGGRLRCKHFGNWREERANKGPRRAGIGNEGGGRAGGWLALEWNYLAIKSLGKESKPLKWRG